MSAPDAYCPRCRRPLDVDERFCTRCGAARDDPDSWSTTAPDEFAARWPSPPLAEPAPDPVPLVFHPAPRRRWPAAPRLALAAILTLALFAGWRVAELRIVDRDPWPYWDAVWIAFAAASVVAVILWLACLRRLWRRSRHRSA